MLSHDMSKLEDPVNKKKPYFYGNTMNTSIYIPYFVYRLPEMFYIKYVFFFF